MADETPKTDVAKSTSPFDVRIVKSLVALMAQHDLSEIDLHDGTQRLRLRRGQNGPIMVSAAHAPATSWLPPRSTPPAGSNAKPDGATPPSAESPPRSWSKSKAPRSAPFTGSPNPDTPPFVRVGSKVVPDGRVHRRGHEADERSQRRLQRAP